MCSVYMRMYIMCVFNRARTDFLPREDGKHVVYNNIIRIGASGRGMLITLTIVQTT